MNEDIDDFGPTQADKLIAGFLTSLPDAIADASQHALRFRLDRVAEGISKMPGILGVIVMALDDQQLPFAWGTSDFDFLHKIQIQELSRLSSRICNDLTDIRWITIGASDVILFATKNSDAIRAVGIPWCSRRQGILFLSICHDKALVMPSLEALLRLDRHIGWTLHRELQLEALGRAQKLQKLASDEFNKPEPDLQSIVEKLASIIPADAATILMEDRGTLRLSASTDKELGRSGPVSYSPGEGLTGQVFGGNEALRIINTEDATQRRQKSIARTAPLHRERDRNGNFTVQFLGVPLRCEGKVQGVIRMSRLGSAMPFSHYDEQSLMFFADFLGPFLARFWELRLTKKLMELESESIVISQRVQKSDGSSVPKVVIANPAAEKLFDRELIGIDARMLYPDQAYEEIREILDVTVFSDHPDSGVISTRVATPSGDVRNIDILYVLLTNNFVKPESRYMIGLIRDTTVKERERTELKRLLEQHRHLLKILEAKKLVYFRSDSFGHTIDPTEIDSEITGYSREELCSMSRADLLYDHPSQRESLLEWARERQEKDNSPIVRTIQKLKRKNEKYFWASVDIRIITDDKGNEIGVEGLYEDVTDRMLLQGFVDAQTDQIMEDHELFVALKENAVFHLDYMTILSHQLQTPLNALIGHLRNFQEGIISRKEMDDRLPYIIGQTVVCKHLVRNLSYVDKILRRESFPMTHVALVKLALEAKINLRHLLREKHIDLVIERDGLANHLVVKGHQDMLRQVIMNLVDNAIKYSFGKTKIIIKGYLSRSRRSNVFEISNHGLPVPKSAQENIFKRGYREKSAEMQVPAGTGLGLWLVRKILDVHDAKITCDTIEEKEVAHKRSRQKRTRFRLIFPDLSLR